MFQTRTNHAFGHLRRWRRVALLGLSLLLIFLGLMFVQLGHVSPVEARAAWTSSLITVTSGNQEAEPPSQTTTSSQKINASTALVRINQLDPTQYDSPSDASTWAYSACSAASLTEVINAYGFAYRIADILHVEAQIGAITPTDGLTMEAGIANTAKLFGFSTTWGHNLNLDQVINAANSGTPVIVSWPPQAYPDGHIVVVTGGDTDNVRIADSSKYNRSLVSRAQFSAWWHGFSSILTPPSDRLAGKPTVTVGFINQVLSSYQSPATGLGQSLYDLGVQYDIDPIYAMAFFLHESQMGTTGMARITHALGNSRCVSNEACVDQAGNTCQNPQTESCYASYASWQDGFASWYRQIIAYENGALKYYLTHQWLPLTQLQTIIPVYAPSSDHNDVTAYISAIQHAVTTWHTGTVRV